MEINICGMHESSAKKKFYTLEKKKIFKSIIKALTLRNCKKSLENNPKASRKKGIRRYGQKAMK